MLQEIVPIRYIVLQTASLTIGLMLIAGCTSDTLNQRCKADASFVSQENQFGNGSSADVDKTIAGEFDKAFKKTIEAYEEAHPELLALEQAINPIVYPSASLVEIEQSVTIEPIARFLRQKYTYGVVGVSPSVLLAKVYYSNEDAPKNGPWVDFVGFLPDDRLSGLVAPHSVLRIFTFHSEEGSGGVFAKCVVLLTISAKGDDSRMAQNSIWLAFRCAWNAVSKAWQCTDIRELSFGENPFAATAGGLLR